MSERPKSGGDLTPRKSAIKNVNDLTPRKDVEVRWGAEPSKTKHEMPNDEHDESNTLKID